MNYYEFPVIPRISDDFLYIPRTSQDFLGPHRTPSVLVNPLNNPTTNHEDPRNPGRSLEFQGLSGFPPVSPWSVGSPWWLLKQRLVEPSRSWRIPGGGPGRT